MWPYYKQENTYFHYFTAVVVAIFLLLGWATKIQATSTPTPDYTPPVVTSLSNSPISPNSLQTVTFTATATDNVGVTAIGIVIDGSEYGSCSKSPCSYTGGPYAVGNHSYRAIAYDKSENQSPFVTKNFTVTDATPPGVTITTPANGANVPATVTITATATDNVGVAGVQFKIDGINLGTEDTISPYSTTWSPSIMGSHSIQAVARDTSGNTTTATINVTVSDTIPPNSPASPVANAASSSTVTVTWTAPTDNVGVTGYSVEQCTGASCSTFVSVGTPNLTSFTSSSLAPSTTYRYRILARDAAGNWSAPSSIVSATTLVGPPTVTLTTNLATILSGQTAILTWSSTGAASCAGSAPASWVGDKGINGNQTISPTATSTYTLSCTGAGGSTSKSVTITVNPDNVDPGVTITTPANHSIVLATVTITATATDNVGVAGVQFKINGVNLGAEDTTAPYSTTWTNSTAGSYSITAVARDLSNRTATDTISVIVLDAIKPTVNITAPASGATVSGSVTITATATDNIKVEGVLFKIDGVNLGSEDTKSPFSATWNTSTYTPGSHTITATARDTDGNMATDTITVIIPDTTKPVVSITKPSAGLIVSGSVAVEATAADNVGVAGVLFKANGIDIGVEDITSPYAVTWNPSVSGSYIITATARDAAGNTAVATVTVVADVTPPTLSVSIVPDPPNSNQTTIITATAQDASDIVSITITFDHASVKTCAASPCSYTTTKLFEAGTRHYYYATARDSLGNEDSTIEQVFRVAPSAAKALVTEFDVKGWAWSGSLGWVSLSYKNCEILNKEAQGLGLPKVCDLDPNITYGLKINVKENVRQIYGWAWAGYNDSLKQKPSWVCFGKTCTENNPGLLAPDGKPPTITYECLDEPNKDCSTYDYKATLKGWARVLDWGNQGWISLSCSNKGTCSTVNYGVVVDFDNLILGQFKVAEGKYPDVNLGWAWHYAKKGSTSPLGSGWVEFYNPSPDIIAPYFSSKGGNVFSKGGVKTNIPPPAGKSNAAYVIQVEKDSTITGRFRSECTSAACRKADYLLTGVCVGGSRSGYSCTKDLQCGNSPAYCQKRSITSGSTPDQPVVLRLGRVDVPGLGKVIGKSAKNKYGIGVVTDTLANDNAATKAIKDGKLLGKVYKPKVEKIDQDEDGDINSYTINDPITFYNDTVGSGGVFNGSGTIIIDGDLVINKNIVYAPVNEKNIVGKKLASVVWIVNGDVKVDPQVSSLAGTFIVLGRRTPICSSVVSSSEDLFVHCGIFSTGNSASKLTVYGSAFARQFRFERTYFDVYLKDPAENFIIDGRLQLNPPPGMSDIAKGLPIFTRQ